MVTAPEEGTADTRTGNINSCHMGTSSLSWHRCYHMKKIVVHGACTGLDMPKIDMSITAEIKRSASSPRSYSGRDGPEYEEVFPTQMVAG